MTVGIILVLAGGIAGALLALAASRRFGKRSGNQSVRSNAEPKEQIPVSLASQDAPRTTGGHEGNCVFRVKFPRNPRMVQTVKAAFQTFGAIVHDIDPLHNDKTHSTRDFTVTVNTKKAGELSKHLTATVPGLSVVAFSTDVMLAHLGGKLEVIGRMPVTNRSDLSILYTPGVADVCLAIRDDPDKAFNLTIKGTTILVVSDGTRVLALGDIGPRAAMPVMEGKCLLLKRFAGVNAVPICLDTKDPDEIIRIVKAIAPGYGGVNLEDIASPGCYDIERTLQEALDIPVFHDDRHGTAVVVGAAAINAAKVVGKQLENMKAVCIGTGAAGLTCIQMLHALGLRDIVAFNSVGVVHKERTDLTDEEQWLKVNSNHHNFKGSLEDAIKGADLVLGLSVEGTIKAEWLAGMNPDGIVFALANPKPEVPPEEALKHVRIMATGGSNYPNQINNALAFPGIFRGLLDGRVRKVTEEMKLAAARALAAVVKDEDLDEEMIIPSVFNTAVAPAVANAIKLVAGQRGLSRRSLKS